MAEAAAPEVRKVAVIGTGVIGAGWATRCLAHGLDVVAWDPGPGAEARLRAAVDNAWPAVAKLGLWPGADRARLGIAATLEEACAGADFVQESAPEREDLKRRLLAEIDAAVPDHVVIASSSSGLLPSRIQADCRHPGRVVIGHPFNPVYLLPLVEVLGGRQSDHEAVRRAMAFYREIGMHALEVRNEIDGYLSDRLQEAVWREILHLVNDGVASTNEIDDAISYGPGLRWAIMGTCLTFHLAGGEGGMHHMLEQFGPALKLPWTKLEAPELNAALVERMVEGTKLQAAGRSVKELERLRDDCLIAIMQALRGHDVGAGRTLAEDEARRLGSRDFQRWERGAEVAAPLALYDCTVLPEWVDYNGHMSEACYLTAFGWASDALFRYVGIDEAYRAAGLSFYTVESHINYLREASTGEPLRFSTQLLGLDEKRLHFFHWMYHGQTGALIATTEQMLLHVDMKAAKTAPIVPRAHEALSNVWAMHRDLPAPEQAGRRMSLEAKG
jgi:carnitine 3-dehydrogenase